MMRKSAHTVMKHVSHYYIMKSHKAVCQIRLYNDRVLYRVVYIIIYLLLISSVSYRESSSSAVLGSPSAPLTSLGSVMF